MLVMGSAIGYICEIGWLGLNNGKGYTGTRYVVCWWLGHPSEKYEFVNWDDEINPILMGNMKKWQPNHQPVLYVGFYDFKPWPKTLSAGGSTGGLLGRFVHHVG